MMILRIFEVQSKPGCAAVLLDKFATTSAQVVQDEPGNQGYFFGSEMPAEAGRVMFVSVWKNLAAVQARFGETWQDSFLPDGYEALIEACTLRHIEVGEGWHVGPPDAA